MARRPTSVGSAALLRDTIALLVVIRVAVSVLPFRRVRSLARRLASLNGRWGRAASVEPEEIARAVSAGSRWVPAASCLTQALAGLVLLARNNHAGTLTVGVRRGEKFGAHAWLYYDGRILLGSDGAGDCVPLVSFTIIESRAATAGDRHATPCGA
jgi:hypothetical protein